MKLLLNINLFLLIMCSCFSQVEKPQNTMYLKGPQVLITGKDFAYFKDYKDGSTLSSKGFGVGTGILLYPEKLRLSEKYHIGFDYGIAEINILEHAYFAENNYYDAVNVMVVSKFGPILSYQPFDKTLIDLYAQIHYGLYFMNYYNSMEHDKSDYIKNNGALIGGMNLGWDKFYISFEYVVATPTVKETFDNGNNTYVITPKRLSYNYFKISALFKLMPFEN